MKLIAAVIALLVLVLPNHPAAGEQWAGKTVRAGVYQLQPFVMNDANGGFTGLGIDLWERCGNAIGLETEYLEFRTIGELVEAVAEGNIDVAITGLSMTRERARRMRFSFPWYDSGFRIMTNKYEASLWTELRHDQRFRVYALFLVIFIVLAFLMYLVRRRRDPEFPAEWKAGYCLCLLDVVTSVRSGRLEQKYLGWIGNLLSLFWLLCGMAAVTYVTSTMTTAMTALSVDRNRISQVSDLTGHAVGVLRGSLPEIHMRALGMTTVASDALSEAVGMLRAGSIRAIVSDAPALEFWLRNNPGHGFELAGPLFRNDKFAFAAPKKNADLMDAVDRELIRLFDTGELYAMHAAYFDEE